MTKNTDFYRMTIRLLKWTHKINRGLSCVSCITDDVLTPDFWQYKAIWCAKQRSNSNRALLARPYGVSLAGHEGPQVANDMAYRLAA